MGHRIDTAERKREESQSIVQTAASRTASHFASLQSQWILCILLLPADTVGASLRSVTDTLGRVADARGQATHCISNTFAEVAHSVADA
jgi:hypothetical protein